jgi:hypothetical protein
MKFIVNTEEHTAMEDGQKALYSSGEDGNFKLIVEGLPDYEAQETRISAMDTKMSELLNETKAAKKLRKEAEQKLKDDAEKKVQNSGDVDAINKSWQEKYDNTKLELTDLRDSAVTALKTETIKREASSLASRLAAKGCEAGLMPHIAPRISVELNEGVSSVVILDTQGKPSAATMEELETELRANASIAPLLSAGSASGSGATVTKTSAKKGLGGTKAERVAAIKSRLG